MKADGLYGIGQWMYRAATGAISYPVQLPETASEKEIADFEAQEAAWDALNMDGLARYPLDTEAAQALLEQAGWTLNEQGAPFEKGADAVRCRSVDGETQALRLTLGFLSDGNTEQAFIDTFAQHLAEAGISLTLVPLHFESIAQAHADRSLDSVDMIYMGDNFNISFDPALFFADSVEEQEADSIKAAYRELYALAEDMDRTQPGAILEYMQKWLRFQERFTQLLPMIPVYTNIYYDFFTKELDGYWIEENVSWAQAIVPARMHSLKTNDISAMDVAQELSFIDGESKLDLASLPAHTEHKNMDYSAGALSLFPEDIQRQVPREYNNIYEFVAGQVPTEIEDESAIQLVYAFQTPYAQG